MDQQKTVPTAGRRRSARDAKRATRTAHSGLSIPYITRKIPFYEVLGEEGLALIENNAETILEEIGIEFREDPEALSIWKAAGADVQGERVRMPRGMCRQLVQATAPREFTQHARNASRNVLIGGPNTVIVSLINVNSPLTYDMTMLGALKVYARANQACIVTPFILAGAISPVTVAGTATQTLAEALAGMAFIQLLNPGAPTRGSIPVRRQSLRVAGWLEGGLAMGYEKFVMDADQAGMTHTLLEGVDLSDNGQALDAIREVGPGNHFLGCAHTLANFETAFHRSPLADNNSFEQWEAEGGKDMAKRANERWKKQLAEYVAPPLDAAVDEALLDYMNRRKASFPDSNV